ncbi:MAG: alpha/beta fold hydrolase [Candidatus Eutrophobiaceae bacterium]
MSHSSIIPIALKNQVRGEGKPIVLLHGMFGSGHNMVAIARGLMHYYQVHSPDLRNHGGSPCLPRTSYPELAADVHALVTAEALCAPILIGHSMGGKVAMTYALSHPESVVKLVVLDIAPLSYPMKYVNMLQAIQAIDLHSVESRQQVYEQLAEAIPNDSLRMFMLTNLIGNRNHGFTWRIDWQSLMDSERELRAFPSFPPDAHYPGQTLFLRGAESPEYVPDDCLPIIARRFPNARIETVENAGHWMHSDQPHTVTQLIRDFLAE